MIDESASAVVAQCYRCRFGVRACTEQGSVKIRKQNVLVFIATGVVGTSIT